MKKSLVLACVMIFGTSSLRCMEPKRARNENFTRHSVPEKKVKKESTQTAFIEAICAGDTTEILRQKELGACLNVHDDEGRLPLVEAARVGDMSTCNLLIYEGAEVNKIDKNGQTALIAAIKSGHYDIMHMLLESGVSLTTHGQGLSALFAAAQAGNSVVLKALLDARVPLNTSSITEMLKRACNVGHLPFVCEYMNLLNCSLLQKIITILAQQQDVKEIALLLSIGADEELSKYRANPIGYKDMALAHKVGYYKIKALFGACIFGHTEIVSLLLKEMPKMYSNTRDKFARTAVLYAMRYGYTDIVHMMLEHQGKAFITNADDVAAAFNYAIKAHDVKAIKILSAFGAQCGMSHIELACKVNDEQVTQAVIENYYKVT